MATVFVSVVGVLAVAVGITGYVYYDRATAPDRSTPGVVVRQYLEAVFDPESGQQVIDYTCGSAAQLGDVRSLVKQIDDRAAETGQDFTVRWERFTTTTSGKTATVEVVLLISTPEANGLSSELHQNWRFSLVDQSGWRVCEAHQVP